VEENTSITNDPYAKLSELAGVDIHGLFLPFGTEEPSEDYHDMLFLASTGLAYGSFYPVKGALYSLAHATVARVSCILYPETFNIQGFKLPENPSARIQLAKHCLYWDFPYAFFGKPYLPSLEDTYQDIREFLYHFLDLGSPPSKLVSTKIRRMDRLLTEQPNLLVEARVVLSNTKIPRPPDVLRFIKATQKEIDAKSKEA